MTTELTIEKLVYGGDGLARLDAGGDGRREAVFVPGVLPGERVRVALAPRARGRRTARLLEVLQPAPERTEPGCEYYGRCGGCHVQHAAYPAQLALKRQVLLETLQRTGGVDWAGEVCMHAAEPWAYRNRIRVQAVPGIGVGYYQAGDPRRVLPITHCPIASAEINRALEELAREPVRRREELELAEARFAARGRPLRVSPGAFFQVNRFLTDRLVEVVTGGEFGQRALDLFSGVGLFAVVLAKCFSAVEAVESNPAAASDLHVNVGGLPVQAVQHDALSYLRARPADPVDLLVADPPRAGLGRELVAEIVRTTPNRLHYVSCDPATLGRDLAMLLAVGYAIRELHLLDLFPQTYHIETVVKLDRTT